MSVEKSVSYGVNAIIGKYIVCPFVVKNSFGQSTFSTESTTYLKDLLNYMTNIHFDIITPIIDEFEKYKPTKSIRNMLYNEIGAMFKKRQTLITENKEYIDNYYNYELIKGRMESIQGIEKMMFYVLASSYLKSKNPNIKIKNAIIKHHCKRYKDFYEKCFAYYCKTKNVIDPYTFLENKHLFNKLYKLFERYNEGTINNSFDKFNFEKRKYQNIINNNNIVFYHDLNLNIEKEFKLTGRYTTFKLYRGRIDKSLATLYLFVKNFRDPYQIDLTKNETTRIIYKSFSKMVLF